MEWKRIRLGDYISIKSGLAYSGSKIGKGNSILLGMGCVSFKEKFVESGARQYDDICDDRFVVKPGDIVLATRQQSDNLPILAMPAIIPQSYQGKRVIFGTNLYKVENKSDIDNRFLFWLFKHQHYVNYIAGIKSGTAVQMVTKKNVEDYKFLCPPANVRDSISNILWTYDNLIENNTKRIKLLEQMAENLYKEWFVRFRFPGYENVEMKNGLPNGWKIERLGNISNISTGKCNREDAEEEGEYPLFDRSQEIKRSSVWIKDCEAIIVPGEGTSFMPRYFKGKFNLHQRCYCVNPNMDNIGFFLFYTLMLNRMYFLSVATGATVPSLRQNNFTKMKFIMPTIELIHKFNSIVQNARNCCDNLYKQNEFLIRQRDLLLPRLMSGKLEVKP